MLAHESRQNADGRAADLLCVYCTRQCRSARLKKKNQKKLSLLALYLDISRPNNRVHVVFISVSMKRTNFARDLYVYIVLDLDKWEYAETSVLHV